MEKERNREYCLELLHEYTEGESLRKHAYAVETCVRAYAEKFGEDTEYWGNVALLHDFDYERYPTMDDHPYVGAEILRKDGFSEDFVLSILSHADYSGEPRDTLLKKTLYACDELAGFITAVALVRPSKSVEDLKVKSVKKKLKDKAFAKAVSREDIEKGAMELGVELSDHIAFCIEAMKKNREVLGL